MQQHTTSIRRCCDVATTLHDQLTLHAMPSWKSFAFSPKLYTLASELKSDTTPTNGDQKHLDFVFPSAHCSYMYRVLWSLSREGHICLIVRSNYVESFDVVFVLPRTRSLLVFFLSVFKLFDLQLKYTVTVFPTPIVSTNWSTRRTVPSKSINFSWSQVMTKSATTQMWSLCDC